LKCQDVVDLMYKKTTTTWHSPDPFTTWTCHWFTC